jgi:transposase-like protein
MYPAAVRRQIVSRLRSGEPVAVVAADAGIRQATLFRWKRQAPVDAGVITSYPECEGRRAPAAAPKRIAGSRLNWRYPVRVRTVQRRGVVAPKTPTREG